MTTAVATFGLLDEPWIPLADLSGRPCSVSLLELFRRARDYRGIEHSDPLVVAAVYRLALALAHRAFDGPKSLSEATAWYERGFPLDRLGTYAETWRHRFDLFDATYPFLQQTGIEREDFRVLCKGVLFTRPCV